ncbi:MAG: ABC transporter substrate-binding protein [Lachnospiraceae bacterium]|nr:ABC transporter substrate-binding protein [Lachnospiraceae bacterium]MDD3616101.1 ABC transporter substrate-binding protein [Lachnospiraceae bacterium]
MKKKYLSILLAGVMSATMLAGCGSAEQAADAGGSSDAAAEEDAAGEDAAAEAPAASADAIRLVNGKIEIDEQLKAIAKTYQEETGQEVVIESMGGGVDIQGQLKSYNAAGNMPDIFVIGGDGDYANWGGKVADLSDCEFVKDTDFTYTDDETGTPVGFPYAVEGYGITYNADILEKAGIDPATLINYDAYKAAFEKIDGMKDELGLTSVCAVAAESGQMYWSTGNHIFGYYLSGGLERDDNTYFDMAMKGEVDTDRMNQFADFVGLLNQYSDQQTLVSGTYDDQLALWAQGKAAFITQGNWIDPSLPDYDVTFNCGIAPLAFTTEDMTSVLADSPSWWCVSADSDKVDACKDFLDYLATSEAGQNCLIKDCGMISPYKSSTVLPETPLALSLKTYVDAGDTSSWAWSNMPEGIAQNAIGLVFESYAKGEIDRDQFTTMMQTQIADYVANN